MFDYIIYKIKIALYTDTGALRSELHGQLYTLWLCNN